MRYVRERDDAQNYLGSRDRSSRNRRTYPELARGLCKVLYSSIPTAKIEPFSSKVTGTIRDLSMKCPNSKAIIRGGGKAVHVAFEYLSKACSSINGWKRVE